MLFDYSIIFTFGNLLAASRTLCHSRFFLGFCRLSFYLETSILKLRNLLPLFLTQNFFIGPPQNLKPPLLIHFSTRRCILSCHCSRFCSHHCLPSVWLHKIHHMHAITRLLSVAGHIPTSHIWVRMIVRLYGMPPQATAVQETSMGYHVRPCQLY